MRETRQVFECRNNCDANMGGRCMWKIDKELSELARDKNYKMCEKLRKGILKNNTHKEKNERNN